MILLQIVMVCPGTLVKNHESQLKKESEIENAVAFM